MSKTVTFVIEPLEPETKGFSLKLVEGAGPAGTVLEETTLPAALKLPGQALDPFTFAKIVRERRKDDFAAAGQHLLALLTAGEVGRKYEELRAAHGDLRTRLCLQAEEAAALPWELLAHDNENLFIRPRRPIVRCHGPAALDDEPQTWPLRVLIVVGSALEDVAVKAEEEIREVCRAVAAAEHALDLEVLRRPKKIEELREAIREHRPHLFHFIGHGALRAGEGILIFEPEGGGDPWILQAKEIPNELVALEWRPHMVLLNACRSAGRDLEQEAAWSMQRAFARAGVRAVLAMQADIRGKTAARLSKVLYRRLAAGECVDVALTRARARILGDEHPIPTLSLACEPERVLPMRPRVSEKIRDELEREFPEVRHFVDRLPLRREALAAFHPFQPEQKERHLLVIVGESRAGKTWVARWCMHTCAQQDYRVRYVPIVDDRGKNWLELLRLIRDGDPAKEDMEHQALDPRAFDHFHWQLAARLAGRQPTPWDGRPVPEDGYGSAEDLAEMTTQDIRSTLDSFREALEAAAREKPLLLVLDDFSIEDRSLVVSEFEEYLRPGLIDPIAEAKVKNVKMVLIVSEEDRRSYGLDKGYPKLETVEVGSLPKRHFLELAIEYLYRTEAVDEDESRENVAGTVHVLGRILKISDPWKIDKLEQLYKRLHPEG